MSPLDIIHFSIIGAVVIVVGIVLLFIFRKIKKLAIVLVSILVIGYIGYILYYPTLKINRHAVAFEVLNEYLEEEYPSKKFNIVPEHFEEGYTAGDFQVNDIKTPNTGMTLRVGKGNQVTQIAFWNNSDYPTKEELWKEVEFIIEEKDTFDKKSFDVIKKDEWVDGELIAFALTIAHLPTIALFNYSKESYELLELQEGDLEGYVIIEKEGYVFTYVNEHYQGETVSVYL